MTTKKTVLPPKYLPPIRSIDYSDGTGESFAGEDVWKQTPYQLIRGSGGTKKIGRPAPAPKKTYSSDLLQQSFTSKAAMEAAEKKERQRRIEQQKKKEQKRFSGTIAGQVTQKEDTPMGYFEGYSPRQTASAVSAFQSRKTTEIYDPVLGFGGKIKRFMKEAKDVPRDIYRSETPTQALSSLSQPLQVFSRRKKGEDIVVQERFGQGSGIYNPQTKQFESQKQFQAKTRTDLLDETLRKKPELESGYTFSKKIGKEVESELLPTYQKKVDKKGEYYQRERTKGRLTQEEAKKLYARDISMFQSDFEKKFGEKFEQKVSERKGEFTSFQKEWTKSREFSTNIPNLVTTGVLVGGSLVGGLPAVASSSVIGGTGLVTAEKGVKEKDYTKVGVGLGMAGLGIAGGTAGLARFDVSSSIKAATKQKPTVTDATRFRSGKYALDKYSTKTDYKATSPFKSNVILRQEGSSISESTGKKTFKIIGGERDYSGAVRDPIKDRILLFGGKDVVLPSKGKVFPDLKADGWTPSKVDLTTSPKTIYKGYVGKGGSSLKADTFFEPSPELVKTNSILAVTKRYGKDRFATASGKGSFWVDTKFKSDIATGTRTAEVVGRGMDLRVTDIARGKIKNIPRDKFFKIVGSKKTGLPPPTITSSKGGSTVLVQKTTTAPFIIPPTKITGTVQKGITDVAVRTASAGSQIVKPITTQKPVTTQTLTGRTIQDTLSKEKIITSNVLLSYPQTKQFEPLTTSSLSSTSLRQPSKLKQIQTYSQLQPMQHFGMNVPSLQTTGGFGGGYFFGGLPFGLTGVSSSKSQFGKQKTKYQPSLTGSILQIKGKGIAPGGLSVRGLVNGKKNKIL